MIFQLHVLKTQLTVTYHPSTYNGAPDFLALAGDIGDYLFFPASSSCSA
jgi:hypothetical protein